MDVNGRRTLLMATEHEDPTALVIFLGIFLGTGRVFRWVLQPQGWMLKELNFQVYGAVEERCWIYKLER